MVQRKRLLQSVLLAAAVLMIGFGVWRGEANMVFSKAIRLCMECVGIG
ncbi:MAG: CD1871A family CXXC motif-containing protein [Christensenellales bacterium]